MREGRKETALRVVVRGGQVVVAIEVDDQVELGAGGQHVGERVDLLRLLHSALGEFDHDWCQRDAFLRQEGGKAFP